MLGLGDREFNDRLRAEKKAARPERNLRPAPIWLPDDTNEDVEEGSEAAGASERKRQSYNPLRFSV